MSNSDLIKTIVTPLNGYSGQPLYAYVPSAGYSSAGIAAYDSTYFIIDYSGVPTVSITSEVITKTYIEANYYNKTQSDARFVNQLIDVPVNAIRLYANTGGIEGYYDANVSALGLTIPIRNQNGNFNVSTPTSYNNVANKEYVDTGLSYKQNITDELLLTNAKTIVGAINEINEVAKGARDALSYSNYQTMITAFNDTARDTYIIGLSIFIITADVPDLWISDIKSTSVPYTYTTDEAFINALDTDGYVQVGYYQLSKLETGKIDLSGYIQYISLAGGTPVGPDSSGIVNIGYASTTTPGLVKNNLGYGIYVNESTGELTFNAPSDSNITLRSADFAILASKLDFAVKAAMTDGVGSAWTTAEKLSARQRIGAEPTAENYNIITWASLSSSEPYTYQTTVTATYTIGANTQVELINNNAVLFGTYGFAIGSVSGQSVTIYSIGQPSSSVTLEVDYIG